MDSGPDVLIVGGGPSGMVMALCLARSGVKSMVVERRKTLGAHPKAHEINARTLEILDTLGIDRRELDAEASPPEDSARVVFCRAIHEELGVLDLLEEDIARQYRDHIRSPVPYLNLSQVELERVLRRAIEAESRIEFLSDTQWEGFADDTGHTSTIKNRTTQTVRHVAHRFLVGADGAASRVREAAGIEMDGPEELQRVVSCAFDADLSNLVTTRGKLYWIFHPGAAGTLIAHHVDRRWVYHVPIDNSMPIGDYDEAYFLKRLRIALGGELPPLQIRSISEWRMSAQVAKRFRLGNTFLVGDAAHRFPPTGGLGLNTGVADAHNLAWKMACVLRGDAADALLDTYEAERRPVAVANSAESRKNFERMFDVVGAFGLPANSIQVRSRLTQILPWLPPLLDRLAHWLIGRFFRNQRVRNAVTTRIREQLPHFDRLGLDIGYVYGQSTTAPKGCRAHLYTPSTQTGARLPHLWLDADQSRSIHDALDPHGFTLLVLDAASWESAVKEADLRAPIQVVAVDAEPEPRAQFVALSGVGPDGALLVRPDGHIAWRTTTAGNPTHLREEASRTCHLV